MALRKPSAPAALALSDRAPSGISRADIIDKTIELLISHWADDLSFSQIAEALGTTTSSLYFFYPNREGLMNDVADCAFAGFRVPKARGQRSWQEELLAWLWAIQKHCHKYPVTLRVMAFEGRVSNAWLAATAPVLRNLRAAGLEGKALTFASTWFLGDATGLIMTEFSSPSFRRPAGLIPLQELAQEDRDNLEELSRYLPEIDSRELLEFGFAQIVKGIEELVATRGVKTKAPGKKASPSASVG
jgi:AcrR family transcriptional regulator